MKRKSNFSSVTFNLTLKIRKLLLKPTLFFLEKEEETKKQNPAVQRDGLGWLFFVDFSGEGTIISPNSWILVSSLTLLRKERRHVKDRQEQKETL